MSGGLLDPCPFGGLTLKHLKILHPQWQKSDKSCLDFFCIFSCHLFAKWVLKHYSGGLLDPGPAGGLTFNIIFHPNGRIIGKSREDFFCHIFTKWVP